MTEATKRERHTGALNPPRRQGATPALDSGNETEMSLGACASWFRDQCAPILEKVEDGTQEKHAVSFSILPSNHMRVIDVEVNNGVETIHGHATIRDVKALQGMDLEGRQRWLKSFLMPYLKEGDWL